MKTRGIFCTTGIGFLVFFLVFSSEPVCAADVVVDSTTGQVELPAGDTLTVTATGKVAVSTEDADAFGVKGDGITESSPCPGWPVGPPDNPDWFLNDNIVTVEAGGMIDVSALGTET